METFYLFFISIVKNQIKIDFVKSQECVGDACLNFELASERFLMLNERRGRRQNERIKTFSEVDARTKTHRQTS